MSKQPPKRLDNASEKKVDQIEVEQQIQATNNASIQLDVIKNLRRRGHDPQVDEKTSKEDEKSTTTVKRNDAIAINYFENDLKDCIKRLQQTFVIKRLLCSDLMLSEEGFGKC
ncbi:unnamed protein product [Rhizophagus irregularis]|nr:unnamed protein product [Rhizophagus irregularis]